MYACFFVAFSPIVTQGHIGYDFFFSIVFLLRLSIRDKFLWRFDLFLISKQNCIQQPTLTITVLLQV